MANVEATQSEMSLDASTKPAVEEIQRVLTSGLQNVADNLVRCAVQQCNSVMNDSSASEHLRKAIESKSVFPAGAVQSAIADNANVALLDKFNEITAGICRQVCDSVLDQVAQSLANVYRNLVISCFTR